MDINKELDYLAHKVTFLATQFPDEPIQQQINRLIGVPAIHQNAAYWRAQELGLLGEPDPETGYFKVLKTPEKWEFSPKVEEIKAYIVYCFKVMEKTERDLDEETMTFWLVGYLASDVLVALKSLLVEKVLATYELTDPKDLKSTYTFYTLFHNSEQMWGRSHFKVQPTGEEQPDNSDAEDGGAEA